MYYGIQYKMFRNLNELRFKDLNDITPGLEVILVRSRYDKSTSETVYSMTTECVIEEVSEGDSIHDLNLKLKEGDKTTYLLFSKNNSTRSSNNKYDYTTTVVPSSINPWDYKEVDLYYIPITEVIEVSGIKISKWFEVPAFGTSPEDALSSMKSSLSTHFSLGSEPKYRLALAFEEGYKPFV